MNHSCYQFRACSIYRSSRIYEQNPTTCFFLKHRNIFAQAKILLSRSKIFWTFTLHLPFLKWCHNQDLIFFYVRVSKQANLSVLLLIKVLFIKEKAWREPKCPNSQTICFTVLLLITKFFFSRCTHENFRKFLFEHIFMQIYFHDFVIHENRFPWKSAMIFYWDLRELYASILFKLFFEIIFFWGTDL